MGNTFGRQERLKSRRLIESLFSGGEAITAYPVRLLWMEAGLPAPVSAQFGVSVPKRRFKRAVDRNLIKRRMREAVRLNKHGLTDALGMKGRQFALMVLYIGNEIPEQSLLEQRISAVFSRLTETL